MNLFRTYRKPHFWSQLLLGMIAILSLPVNSTANQTQQIYNQAYLQSQQLEQAQPVAPLFYQQRQQIELQHRVVFDLPQLQTTQLSITPQRPFFVVPPIRAGPQLHV